MHLGLIGGTGPAATLKYYAGLCAAMADRDVPLSATIAHMDITQNRKRTTAEPPEAQAAAVAARIGDLKAAGAEIAVLTAISGHAILDLVQAASPLPIASVLPVLTEHAQRAGLRRIGIIGSLVAMETRAMGAYAGIETVIPEDAETRAEISRNYFEMAIARRSTDTQRALLFEAGRALVEDQGAEAVLLGGTDLCLAFDGRDPGYMAIDAVDLHVAALADLAAA